MPGGKKTDSSRSEHGAMSGELALHQKRTILVLRRGNTVSLIASRRAGTMHSGVRYRNRRATAEGRDSSREIDELGWYVILVPGVA